MEVLTLNISYNIRNYEHKLPTELKMVSLTKEYEFVFKILEDNVDYFIKYRPSKPKKHLEYNLLFEIFKNSPLWVFTYDIKRSKYCNGFCDILITIYINIHLINDYIDKSAALNLFLLTNYDENTFEFEHISNDISFIPNNESFNPPSNFKVNLYEYQKKSLGKMISLERQTDKLLIEYTKELEFEDMKITFNPLSNTYSEKKYLELRTKGGVLSDEMGLGKTITTVALIMSNPSTLKCSLKYSQKNETYKIYSKATLVVCPSHLTAQWKTEILKCNPNLKIITILTKRENEKIYLENLVDADVIITSHQYIMNFKYYPSLYYYKITPVQGNHTRTETINRYIKNSLLENLYNNNAEPIIDNLNEDIKTKIRTMHEPIFEFFHFHRLVLDEGHEIFGEMLTNNSLSNYMSGWLNSLDVDYTWYISGSPFVNYKGIINCSKFIDLSLTEEKHNVTIPSKNFMCRNNILFGIINKEYIWNNILEKICIRHRKCDITENINIHGYEEHIEWIEFTETETKIYNSKKHKYNKQQLLQFCCHPLIIEANKKFFGSEEINISTMQTKLIEHHQDNITTYENKLSKLISTAPAYAMTKKNYETQISESKYVLSILLKMTEDVILEGDDKNCSICLDEIVDGSVTKCAHIFCTNCIKQCMQYKMICPMCKKNLSANDVYTINKKPQEKSEGNLLIEKYGSKLGKIISMIRSIIVSDDARVIVFSQWDNMLNLIGHTLSENGIANSFIKGNVWNRNSAINKFKNGKTLSGEDNKVIMLSLKNSASGTNLTEATHIFFVEPIDANKDERKAIEGQAIGRACRLGQKSKVKLYRILLKNTVEEDVFNFVKTRNIVI